LKGQNPWIFIHINPGIFTPKVKYDALVVN